MSKSFYMINQNTCTRVKLYGIDVKNLFLINGYVEDNKEKSDYIIINTCSFLKTKEEYFMNYINSVYTSKNYKLSVSYINYSK